MGDEQSTITQSVRARDRYAPVPGLVYLRKPRSAPVRPTPRELPTTLPKVQTTAGDGGATTAQTSGDTQRETAGNAGDARDAGKDSARSAVASRIGMLVRTWLEVLDGHRPVTVLRKGPFSPTVTETLRGVLRNAGSVPTSPSRVLSVAIPPSHRDRLGFTASVARDGRVRAVVGHLSRYDGRWRVESITLI